MSRVFWRLSALAALLALGLAWAVDYRVEEVGEEGTLAAEVEAAVGAWNEVADEPVAVAAEDARNVFALGPAERFGPDVQSLTVASGAGAEREVRVLINPGLSDRRGVLLHEVGILIGLPESEEGVMNPLLGPSSPSELGSADVAALTALVETPREDINRDGVVDFYDLVALARAFGQTGVNLPADINEDGVVDQADLALLEAAYTFSAPAETPADAPETEPLPEGELPAVPGPVDTDDLGDPADFDPQAPEEDFEDEFDGLEDDLGEDFNDEFNDEFGEPGDDFWNDEGGFGDDDEFGD